MGAVSAAGSLGLVIASPLAQTLISTAGWQVALIGFLGLVAVMLPAAFFAGRADEIEIEKADDGRTSRLALWCNPRSAIPDLS